MRRISTPLVPSLVIFAVLAFAGSASAATTVGSNLAATPTNSLDPNVSVAPRTQLTGVTLPLTAPTGGVIVQILVKHGASGANAGVWGFRVLSGTPTLYSTPGPPVELPDFAWPANDTAGTRAFTPSLAGVPKGIPIAAGDRLGIVRVSGIDNQGPLIVTVGSSAAADGKTGVHNSGSQNYNLPLPGVELTIQYRIEPDADRDGFGDETQDKCPTNAAIQAACPVTPVKKCKKKKKKKKGKRSADAAKKKKKRGCKKKRKKKK